MEVLNGLISHADRNGFLTPLPSRASECRACFYADDLVVFLSPSQADAVIMLEILKVFGEASGLFTNMNKCVASAIRCSPDQVDIFSSCFGYRANAFPCRYLGIPLFVHKLKGGDEHTLIDSVARRIPGWKGRLLNLAGRTTLTVVTLSAIPTHTTIVVCLSPWAVKQIDKRRRAFLWSGTDHVAGAWWSMSGCMANCVPSQGAGRTGPRGPPSFRCGSSAQMGIAPEAALQQTLGVPALRPKPCGHGQLPSRYGSRAWRRHDGRFLG